MIAGTKATRLEGSNATAARAPRPRRRGYSFTEVMFAVVVLGIGFIMIAAMFPVAISQQQSTQQETNAAAIARAATNYFQSVATVALLPPTGTAAQPNRPRVLSVLDPQKSTNAKAFANDDLWNALKGNLIVPSDRRYGIVMMYSRAGDLAAPDTAPRQAQLIVIVTQVRNRSTYGTADVSPTPTDLDSDPLLNLQARPVQVDIAANQLVTVTGDHAGSVAEGSYLVISEDNIAGANQGAMNGRIYRIGQKGAGANQWELAPGNEFKPYDPDGPPVGGNGAAPVITSLTGADAFIVGRNTTADRETYDGLAQDIAVYTTFIQVR